MSPAAGVRLYVTLPLCFFFLFPLFFGLSFFSLFFFVLDFPLHRFRIGSLAFSARNVVSGPGSILRSVLRAMAFYHA